MTLPLILAMQHGTLAEQHCINTALKEGDRTQLPQIIDIIQKTGAESLARKMASDEAARAQACLSTFPPSPYRDLMIALGDYVIERQY